MSATTAGAPQTLNDVDAESVAQVPCEASEGCDQLADWLGVMRHHTGDVCARKRLCEPHRTSFRNWETAIVASGWVPLCSPTHKTPETTTFYAL